MQANPFIWHRAEKQRSVPILEEKLVLERAHSPQSVSTVHYEKGFQGWF